VFPESDYTASALAPIKTGKAAPALTEKGCSGSDHKRAAPAPQYCNAVNATATSSKSERECANVHICAL